MKKLLIGFVVLFVSLGFVGGIWATVVIKGASSGSDYTNVEMNGNIKFDSGIVTMKFLTNNSGSVIGSGSVVVIDSTKNFSATVATTTGDIRVAGVAANNSEHGEDVELIRDGYCYVHVWGAVNRGDFLQTSGSEIGFAQATATAKAGVFGIALQEGSELRNHIAMTFIKAEAY